MNLVKLTDTNNDPCLVDLSEILCIRKQGLNYCITFKNKSYAMLISKESFEKFLNILEVIEEQN